MNREIKFRGKRVDTGEWVYGGVSNHIKDHGRVFITIMTKDHISDIGWHQEVIPDSVGQFTGLTDKHGVDVYEGDVVVQSKGLPHELVYAVFWKSTERHCGWYMDDALELGSIRCETLEVIGTIHDKEVAE